MKKTGLLLSLYCALSSGKLLAEGSESVRQTEVAHVAVKPIGLTMMPVVGLRAAYYMRPNLLVEAGGGHGSASIGDWSVAKTILDAKAKWFLGNSFYVDGGAGLEMFSATFPIDRPSAGLNGQDPGHENVSGSVRNIGLEAHIGNQWSWDSGFMLGVDWLGYFASLSSTSSFGGNDEVDQIAKADEQTSIASNLGSNSLHLGRVYLGYSF